MRRSAFVSGLALVPVSFACSAGADTAKLAVGDAFPEIVGSSPAGERIELPGVRAGQPFVVLYANSQKGGDAIALWSHALFKALPATIAVFAIADLSGVPGLFRGFAIKGIRTSVPLTQPQHRDRILVVTARNPMGGLVPAGNGDDAVIIAVDGTGHVFDVERRAYNDAAIDDVVTRLMALR
jgi:hypothetical protein